MFTYFEHPAKLVSHIGASKRCIETYGPMNAEIGVECGGENRNLLGDFAYGAKCSRKVRRDRNRDQEDSKKKSWEDRIISADTGVKCRVFYVFFSIVTTLRVQSAR